VGPVEEGVGGAALNRSCSAPSGVAEALPPFAVSPPELSLAALLHFPANANRADLMLVKE